MFETNCHLDRIDRSNIVKKFIYLFLSIVGVIFIVLIQCSFAKVQLNVTKNFETIFAACATVSISSKSVTQVLKVKFFFPSWCHFSHTFSNKKYFFWRMKCPRWKERQTLVEKLNATRYYKKTLFWQNLEPCKVFILKNNTAIDDRDIWSLIKSSCFMTKSYFLEILLSLWIIIRDISTILTCFI